MTALPPPSADEGQARQAEMHVATLRRTFGDTPTWGMVEMAFRTGWVAAETGWRYKAPDDGPAA